MGSVMNRVLLLLLALFIVNTIAIDNVFVDFMKKYNKQYTTKAEQALRYEIFKTNLLKIEEHNKVSTFQLGMNQFADMTLEEFVKTKLSANSYSLGGDTSTFPAPAADSVDWRTNKDPVVVPPVRNSGANGSSVVEAIIDSIGADYVLVPKEYPDDVWIFDERFVDECAGSVLNQPEKVWAFIEKWGIPFYYMDCPTEVFQGMCISGHECIKSGSEIDLAAAVAKLGPITINIDASHATFQLYTSGIYYEPKCNSTQLSHEMLLVGYGTSNGQDYWIARNSWGVSWGQQGDILIARNKNNNCGVASVACYAKNIHPCMC